MARAEAGYAVKAGAREAQLFTTSPDADNERYRRAPTAALHAREAEEFRSLPGSLPGAGDAVVLGVAALIGGSRLLVEGAVGLARTAGVLESAIGLTLVAVGTSLPELATSEVAAYRRHADVAVGNDVGILGVAGMVSPLAVSPQPLRFDLWVMLGASLVLPLLMARGRRLGRPDGALFLACYAAYVALLHAGRPGVLRGAAEGWPP